VRKKAKACLKSNASGLVMINIAKEMKDSLLSFVSSVLTPKTPHNNIVTDPIQLKRRLKNSSKYRPHWVTFTTVVLGIYVPVQSLYSSLIDYAAAQIRAKTIISVTTKLKERGLEYTPDALVKYGIVKTEKEPKSNDPEDDRIMRILTKLFNKIKFSADKMVFSIK
jgi:hypothetical protein